MGLFDKPKKKKLKPGQRVEYIIPERRFLGTIQSRPGRGIYMVALDDPKCVCQVSRAELRRIKKKPK